MPTRTDSKPGWLAKRREKKRLKRERTGDTREKTGERPAETYDPRGMADRAAGGGAVGLF